LSTEPIASATASSIRRGASEDRTGESLAIGPPLSLDRPTDFAAPFAICDSDDLDWDDWDDWDDRDDWDGRDDWDDWGATDFLDSAPR
jgi:hypothetical protein